MDLRDLHRVSAVEAARGIREGVFTSLELVQACLARVREVDGAVQAWAFLDPDYALKQACRIRVEVFGLDDLDRYLPSKLVILGQVDFAHAPASEQL